MHKLLLLVDGVSHMKLTDGITLLSLTVGSHVISDSSLSLNDRITFVQFKYDPSSVAKPILITSVEFTRRISNPEFFSRITSLEVKVINDE